MQNFSAKSCSEKRGGPRCCRVVRLVPKAASARRSYHSFPCMTTRDFLNDHSSDDDHISDYFTLTATNLKVRCFHKRVDLELLEMPQISCHLLPSNQSYGRYGPNADVNMRLPLFSTKLFSLEVLGPVSVQYSFISFCDLLYNDKVTNASGSCAIVTFRRESR